MTASPVEDARPGSTPKRIAATPAGDVVGAPLPAHTPGGPRLGWDLAVIGLGYVGLPLVEAAAHVGLRVVGIDNDTHKVASLNAGESHVDDLDDHALGALLTRGFRATHEIDVLGLSDTVVICVPTPLDDGNKPDLGAVIASAEAIAAQLRPGMLVVLESTTWPGTTDEVVRPILERSGLRAGVDFNLAYSPERIDPGNPTFGLCNTPKVVGGLTPECRDRAASFYEKFVERVVPVDGLREAEMTKLLENTYRHVNIALVNEMAIFCDELGIDLWQSIEAAASKPFGFQAFTPGPGVGGHCIPVDPNYLSYAVRKLGYPFRMVELAQEVNQRMPAYVTSRVQRLLNDVGLAVRGSRVLLLGVTYKADIADDRESPAVDLARRLRALGADVEYGDPLVRAWSVDDLRVRSQLDIVEAAKGADVVVLLQAHAGFDLDAVIEVAPRVLDTRGVLPHASNVERL